MSKNIYRGKRYVPKIIGVWDNTKKTNYESLSIVTWEGNSYTSKKDVPEGVDITNSNYWVPTGNYNAQVEIYRQEVRDCKENVLKNNELISENTNTIKDVNNQIIECKDNIIVNTKDIEYINNQIKGVTNVKTYGAIGDGANDDTIAVQNALNKGGSIYFPNGSYVISKTLTLPSKTNLTFENNAKLVIKSLDETSSCIILNENVEDITINNMSLTVDYNIGVKQFVIKINGVNNIELYNLNIDGGSVYNEELKSFYGGINQGIDISNSKNVKIEKNTLKNFRTSHAIATTNTENITITNNYIENTKRAGISLNSGTKECKINSNILINTQRDNKHDGAIDMYGYNPICENIIIENNIIKSVGNGNPDTINDQQNNCIRLKDGKNIIVKNNTMYIDKPLWGAIIISDRDESLMANITIDNNTVIIDNKIRYLFYHIKTKGTKFENLKIINNTFKSNRPYFPESSNYDYTRFQFNGNIKDVKILNNTIDIPNERYQEIDNVVFKFDGEGTQNVNISNNTINCTKRGIDIINANIVFINDNYFNCTISGGIINFTSGDNNIFVNNNLIESKSVSNTIRTETVTSKVVENNIEVQTI